MNNAQRDNYGKRSKANNARRQWRERAEYASTTIGAPTNDSIREFVQIQAASYNCDPNDISYKVVRIDNEDDPDKDDAMLLIYSMKCVIHSRPTTKVIFTQKIRMSEQAKRRIDEMRQQMATSNARARPRRGVLAICNDPQQPAAATEPTAPITSPANNMLTPTQRARLAAQKK